MSERCPECETPVIVETDNLEAGDTLECDECGLELEIASLAPFRVVRFDAFRYDDPEETSFPDEAE